MVILNTIILTIKINHYCASVLLFNILSFPGTKQIKASFSVTLNIYLILIAMVVIPTEDFLWNIMNEVLL